MVVGYDLDRETVLLRSGQTRALTMTLHTFERTWARSQRWGFVVLPTEDLPATATLAAVREGRLGFERIAPSLRSVLAWRTALKRWPADSVLGLGVGNSLAAAGETAAAIATFSDLAQSTDSAAAWNNLASLRLKTGDVADARQAALRTVQRAKAAESALLGSVRGTLAEIDSAPTGGR